MQDQPQLTPQTAIRLQMASLILAVQTARFEDKEFAGTGSPRLAAQIWRSLSLAERLCKRAYELYPEWFQ